MGWKDDVEKISSDVSNMDYKLKKLEDLDKKLAEIVRLLKESSKKEETAEEEKSDETDVD